MARLRRRCSSSAPDGNIGVRARTADFGTHGRGPQTELSMSTKVVISGATGRMGQTLVSLISHAREFELVGGIDRDRKTGGDAARYGFRTIETAETATE